jgi:predicted nucleic acid-binding protein
VTDVEADTDPSDLKRLDAGETHALAVARSLGGTIVTDDDPARRRAGTLGVELTGSLGILVRAIEQDRLTVDGADEKLARWINKGGYHSPVASITDIL